MKMERMPEQRVNVNFYVELQKLPRETLKMLKKQFMVSSQAKEATNVKVQDQNNVDLHFRHQGYHPL
jgi:hypothetical protein